jgi:DNA-binding response OmpR family regulator
MCIEASKTLDVLLIKTDPIDAGWVKEALIANKEPQFFVVWVSELAEGLTHLAGNLVNAILLDLFLSDSRGYYTCKRLHASARPDPTTLLTGSGDETQALKAVRHGAQGCLLRCLD